MIGPTSKLRIPEKPCGINQTQIDRLRLLTLSTSSKVASLDIMSTLFRPRLEFSKPKTALNKVLVSSFGEVASLRSTSISSIPMTRVLKAWRCLSYNTDIHQTFEKLLV